MNSRDLKRTLLKVFIGFLSLTAGIAILSVVTGEFGDFQVKVLATTLTISAASICSMSCAAFIEIRRKKVWGAIGIGVACLAACLVIGGVWGEFSDDEYWRATGSCIVVAVAFAHGFLLVLPSLAPVFRWIFLAGPVCIGVLAVQILLILWEVTDSELFFRAVTVNSILVVLLTLVVPILMRMGGARSTGATEVETSIRLTRRYKDVFADDEGALFRVIPESEWPRVDD